MSGHSKWAGIKHHKMAQDNKRGKMFTRLIREITISAREGGGNIDNNSRLRKAIELAREANMPQDNIKKSIQRGTGELPGLVYEETSYDGYGPGGVAVMVHVTSDNKNRTTAEIRRMFSQHNGNMGETGCVSWVFKQSGYITVDKKKYEEDKLMSLALDAGADDLKTEDDNIYEIITSPANCEKVKEELKKQNIEIIDADVTMIPSTYIKLEGKEAEQMVALMNELEEHDDVSNVYANFDIPDELMQKISA